MAIPKKIYKMIPTPISKTKSVSLELMTVSNLSISGSLEVSVYDIDTKVDLYPLPQRNYVQQSPLIVRHPEHRRVKHEPRKNQSALFSVFWVAVGYALLFLYMEIISIDKFPKLKKLLKPLIAAKASPLLNTSSLKRHK